MLATSRGRSRRSSSEVARSPFTRSASLSSNVGVVTIFVNSSSDESSVFDSVDIETSATSTVTPAP